MHIMQMSSHKYDDGTVFSGPLRETDGTRHGEQCSVTSAGGEVYRGPCEEGLFDGLGTLTLTNGAKYSGQFSGGRFHGVGVLAQTSGLVYQGEFRDGKVTGKGRMTFPDGSHGLPRQEGLFDNYVLKTQQKCDSVVNQAITAAKEAAKNS